MIVSLLPLSDAIAAPIEEVVRPRGLLLLGGFQQWASLAYEYNGHDSSASKSGSYTNHFMEKYHLGVDASVIDPHLLRLRLDGDAWLDQSSYTAESTGTQSSNSVRYRYSFVGSAFDRTPYPVTLISSREIGTVVTPFVPAFTSDSTQNGINVALLNNIVPVWFQYQRTTVETSGLSQDYSTTSDSLNLRGSYDFRGISHTEASISVNSQDQTTSGHMPTSSTSYGLTISNGLFFDKEKRYSLSTGLTTQHAKNGEIPQESLEWTENFTALFGKALHGTFTNWYRYNKTRGFDNREQILASNTTNGMLTHRLGESVETRVGGRYRQSEILDGHESSYAGSAGMNYRKKLPAASNLSLSVTGDHEVTERNILGTLLFVRDELHAGITSEVTSIPLNIKGNLLGVDKVRGTFPVPPFEQTFTENEDYIVLPEGVIEILPTGDLAIFLSVAPVDLYITYQVRINPSDKKYTTDTITSAANLSLFKNRYRLSVLSSVSDQELVSGDAADSSLNSTTSNMVHFDANYPSNTFSLEYATYKSSSSNHHYFEGGWRFDRRFSRGSVSLRARDRYTIFEPTAVGRGRSENTIEFGSALSRSLSTWLQVAMSANYINTRGDNVSRDYAYFRMNLQGRLNKATISLIGQTIFRIRSTETTRDDHLRIEVTRYF